jgi:hypothetical protein
MISSFTEFCPPDAPAFAKLCTAAAPASAQAPVTSRFLRDTAILVMAHSPFHLGFLNKITDTQVSAQVAYLADCC